MKQHGEGECFGRVGESKGKGWKQHTKARKMGTSKGRTTGGNSNKSNVRPKRKKLWGGGSGGS